MKRFLKGTENLLGKSNGGIKEYFLNNFPQKFADIKKAVPLHRFRKESLTW